jgi:hypothetical protein
MLRTPKSKLCASCDQILKTNPKDGLSIAFYRLNIVNYSDNRLKINFVMASFKHKSYV